MYGAGGGGTFAFVCVLKDRHGKALGEGRGVADARTHDNRTQYGDEDGL